MTATTKITFNRDHNEYRVRLFIDGEYQAGADYFTDDKQDAKDTAEHMVANAGLSDKTTEFAQDEQAEYDAEMAEYAASLTTVSTPEFYDTKPVMDLVTRQNAVAWDWSDEQYLFCTDLLDSIDYPRSDLFVGLLEHGFKNILPLRTYISGEASYIDKNMIQVGSYQLNLEGEYINTQLERYEHAAVTLYVVGDGDVFFKAIDLMQ